MEYFTPAIYHATSNLLNKIDRVQEGFLHQLGLTSEEAFCTYNFAPLGTRRDIAILGLLHKCNVGTVHSKLGNIFHRDANPRQRSSVLFPPLHNLRMFDDHDTSHQSSLYQRSIFSQIRVYNLLRPEYVENRSVVEFQANLTAYVKKRCQQNMNNWRLSLSGRNLGVVFSIG